MSEAIISQTKAKMEDSLQALAGQLAKIHSGRASAAIVEDIQVEYYGSTLPLKQVGSISTPEPRQILIQAWDKNALPAIEKAIRNSDLGFNPQTDDAGVRINIPQLTEERRKELSKVIDGYTEKTRVTIRAHRQDAIKEIRNLETAKEISEDDSRRWQDKVQAVTDEFNKKIEDLHKQKSAEILSV